VTAPEHQSEEEKKEAEEAAAAAAAAESAVEDEDPFVEPKRPVYLLQHHPSQRNIKEPDLKL
jgi:hypothetical protein